MLTTLYTYAEERDNKCPPPCTRIKIETVSRSIPHDFLRLSFVMMYYISNYQTLQEEYLIFDNSSILVAIGGSLGLFIGFSFFQCGNLILEIFQKFMKLIYEKCKKNAMHIEHRYGTTRSRSRSGIRNIKSARVETSEVIIPEINVDHRLPVYYINRTRTTCE